MDSRAQAGTAVESARRVVSSERGAWGFDPEAGRGRASVGDTDGDGSSGSTGDTAGADSRAGPDLFGIELRFPTRTRRSPGVVEGEGIRGRRSRICGGRGPIRLPTILTTR